MLYSEINPGLAAHGGNVTLEELYDENIAVLRFGGGCQGCGMVDVTLKEGGREDAAATDTSIERGA